MRYFQTRSWIADVPWLDYTTALEYFSVLASDESVLFCFCSTHCLEDFRTTFFKFIFESPVPPCFPVMSSIYSWLSRVQLACKEGVQNIPVFVLLPLTFAVYLPIESYRKPAMCPSAAALYSQKQRSEPLASPCCQTNCVSSEQRQGWAMLCMSMDVHTVAQKQAHRCAPQKDVASYEGGEKKHRAGVYFFLYLYIIIYSFQSL